VRVSWVSRMTEKLEKCVDDDDDDPRFVMEDVSSGQSSGMSHSGR